MSTLWKKDGVDTDEDILAFTIGEDRVLDNQLVPYDVIGSLAHARGLLDIGLLNRDEHEKIKAVLARIHAQWHRDRFQLQPDDEDMHTALERELTEKLGDVGKKIHTGRSRNDQVLTALRLYMKASLLELMSELFSLVEVTSAGGQQRRNILMPGYTHMQRAMPSTVGFWYASFADSFTDTLEAGKALYERLDRSPLGAAAGFGVPLPLNRELTARLMGFEKGAQVNAAAVQNSRGRLEAALIGWLVEFGRDVEKLSFDLLLFSSAEFGFVRIPEEFCTGSSIMPQKKNPDIIELLRGSAAVFRACLAEIEHTISKLPSNYHRDFQNTKGPLLRSVSTAKQVLSITKKLFLNLEWESKKLEQACSIEIFATHRAVELAQNGATFRDAYRQTAAELREGKTGDWNYTPAEVISGLKHLGAPGNPGLDEAEERARKVLTWLETTFKTLQSKWQALLGD